MRKLRLDPDELRVETFATDRIGGRGTVDANEAAAAVAGWTDVEEYSCYEDCTTQGEDLSCMATCESLTYYAPGCDITTAAAV